MSKTYVALIADAIASRELPPAARARLQADARTAVKDLNQRYRRVLAARFAVTLGDELQCLLPTPQPVWDVAHDLRARLPTVDWVVACGRGPITTPQSTVGRRDRKSTRLNSSHGYISYAVFCLKKKKRDTIDLFSFD